MQDRRGGCCARSDGCPLYPALGKIRSLAPGPAAGRRPRAFAASPLHWAPTIESDGGGAVTARVQPQTLTHGCDTKRNNQLYSHINQRTRGPKPRPRTPVKHRPRKKALPPPLACHQRKALGRAPKTQVLLLLLPLRGRGLRSAPRRPGHLLGRMQELTSKPASVTSKPASITSKPISPIKASRPAKPAEVATAPTAEARPSSSKAGPATAASKARPAIAEPAATKHARSAAARDQACASATSIWLKCTLCTGKGVEWGRRTGGGQTRCSRGQRWRHPRPGRPRPTAACCRRGRCCAAAVAVGNHLSLEEEHRCQSAERVSSDCLANPPVQPALVLASRRPLTLLLLGSAHHVAQQAAVTRLPGPLSLGRDVRRLLRVARRGGAGGQAQAGVVPGRRRGGVGVGRVAAKAKGDWSAFNGVIALQRAVAPSSGERERYLLTRSTARPPACAARSTRPGAGRGRSGAVGAGSTTLCPQERSGLRRMGRCRGRPAELARRRSPRSCCAREGASARTGLRPRVGVAARGMWGWGGVPLRAFGEWIGRLKDRIGPRRGVEANAPECAPQNGQEGGGAHPTRSRGRGASRTRASACTSSGLRVRITLLVCLAWWRGRSGEGRG